MPDVTPNATPDTTATPVPVDTQSAPITGGLTPPPAATPPPVQTPAAQPQPQKPGEFMHNLSHAFVGSVLGAMAGREKIDSYQTDATGKQTPVTSPKTTGDQLRDIARSALLGLAAGSSAEAQGQKSGLAKGLAGIGAGASDAVERAKEKDLLLRKQSTEEYERGQRAILQKAQNAHLIIETAKMGQDLANATYESQSKQAAVGQDMLAAASEAGKDGTGGNRIVVQDLHRNEMDQFRKDHPEYLKYTPFLSKVLPVEGAQPDPKTGEVPTDRFYSLVEGDKPVTLTPTMVSSLKAVGMPGADQLTPEMTVPFNQFTLLQHQYLKRFNEANQNRENWSRIDSTDAAGNPIVVDHNSVTDMNRVITNPLTQQPLTGKEDPLAKIEHNPAELAGDKAAAAIPQLQNWYNNTTDPVRKARIGRAIAVATTAQQAYEHEKRSEIQAENDIRQGSPTAAAQTLLSGDTTLADLKARGSTPEFIVSTVKEAERMSGGKYHAADEVVAEQLAKSPQNIQFFGSGHSLLNKGGQIDRVLSFNNQIPDTGIPELTNWADATKMAAGNGPLAGYAAAVLGMADDYSKVMSGGVGTDAARDAGVALVGRGQTRDQRKRALTEIAHSVFSQTDSKIGTNQFSRRSWGFPDGTTTDLLKEPQSEAQVMATRGATHGGKMASDGKTPVYLMKDNTVQDAAGNKYNPATLQRLQ